MIGAILLLSAAATPPDIPRLTVCQAMSRRSAGELFEIAGVVHRDEDDVRLVDSRCPEFTIRLDFRSSDDQPWISFSTRSCPGKNLIAVLRGRLNNRNPDLTPGEGEASLYFVQVTRMHHWKCVAR